MPRSGLISSLSKQSVSLVIQALVRSLSLTTLPFNHFYGACVGRALWWTNNEPKRIAQTNLKIAFPDLSTEERDELLRNSLLELGKTATELGPIWTWGDRRIRRLITDVEGQQHLDAAFAAGRGVIALSPHFGSWELAGLYLSIEYGITSLYRPPRLNSLESFTRRVRERFGAELVPTDLSGVRALRRALARNEMVGILPDQDPGESGGTYAPLFGYPARTMLLVSRLAAKTGAPVIFAIAERLQRGRGFRLRYVPADSRIFSSDDVTAATALNEGMESIIRMNPAQYQWTYKRYKSTIDGRLNPYQQQRRAA